MCESLPPNKHMPVVLDEEEDICMDSPADRNAIYKSDTNMSEEEIIQGFMDIADLPDEPHKYSSSRTCTKT